MSKVDSFLASAKVVADVRQKTADALWSAERKLLEIGASGEGKEDLLIDLKCLRNKLRREEGHLTMLLDKAFSADSQNRRNRFHSYSTKSRETPKLLRI